jgi:two-component system cell cycle sensor histidine kinase/response regulator CckA
MTALPDACDSSCMENDASFQLFFHANPLPMWVFDNESLRILAVNEAATLKYGWTEDEFLKMTIEGMRPIDELERLRTYRARVVAEPTAGANQTVSWKHRTKAGAVIYVESTWLEIPFRGKKAVLVITLDRTDQHEAEQRAREQAAMLNLASDAIIVHDLYQTVISWNHGAERLYGWNEREAVGKTLTDLFVIDAAVVNEGMASLLKAGEWSGELKQKGKDGREIFVNSRWNLVRDENGAPRSVLVINTDTTNARQLERQFLRAQRLESLGTLASGIAHDLNNILSPILMATGLLRRTLESDEDGTRMLNIIENSAERGAGVVKQVLTFARGAEGQRVAIQVKHLLNELSKIMAQTFPRNMDIQAQLPKDLWVISGDPTQLHQVLLNLCVNARDAVMSVHAPESGPEPVRRLTITAENADIDQHFASMNPGATLGPHVVVSVRDTGTGMTPEVMDKIFDPFFTTKEPGKGTGLGLATVIGIVKGHGGFLTVQSEVGKGTIFKVYVPASKDGTEGEGPSENVQPVERGQGELVLVVDDEAPIREALVSTLETNGYHCFTAEDGSDALAVYFSRRDEIDLIVTDLAMAQMDGIKLIRNLRRLGADVRVVVSSGHIQKEAMQELVGLGVRHFLEKPYSADKLLRTMRRALGAARRSAEQ